MKVLYVFMNFLSVSVPLEKVKTEGVERLMLNGFTLSLRFFSLWLGYIGVYLIAKLVQFVISLFLSGPIEDVRLGYLLIPIFILFELGASIDIKWSVQSWILAIIRIALKFSIFYPTGRRFSAAILRS